jgi:hypothetical protein
MKSAYGEEMIIIEPATMEFVFRFAPGECHEVATGTCSLEKERPTDPAEMGWEEGHYDYCTQMLLWMQGQSAQKRLPFDRVSQSDPIEIGSHDCGHYSFNGGKHRTCIARRKGLSVWAVIEPAGDRCEDCDPRPASDDDVTLITPPGIWDAE